MTTDREHISRFVPEDHESDPTLSEACHAFEKYLAGQGYEPAADVCPWADGEYFGAVDAYDLVDNFIGEEPVYEASRDEITTHACEIGPISNAFSGDDEPNEPDWDEDEPNEPDNEPDY